MRATITTAGITGTAAHIQQALPGSSGPIIFSMTETTAGSGIWVAEIVLNDAQLSTLRSGAYYFNVRSAAFPDGEIRGQIQAGVASGTTVTNVNAAPATATGTGTAGTTGNTSFATTPSTTTGIGTTGTGIGTTTGTGTTGTGIGTMSGTGTTGIGIAPTATGTSAVTGSATNTTRTTFVNLLTGSQQVPPTTSAALAVGVTIIDGPTATLTASVTSIGITGTSAHIHEAAAGANGAVFLGLDRIAAGSEIWTARANLNETQIAALNASNFYFDIHSAAFPNGEIRTQIGPVTVASQSVPVFTTDTTNPATGISGVGTTGTGTTGIGNTGTTGIGTTGTTGIGTTGTTGITGTTGTVSPANGLLLITF